jgi:HK97 family phage prohead protease
MLVVVAEVVTRQVLTRQVSFLRRDDGAGTDSDGHTLVGLAVPFNSPTRIDSWFEGTFDEQFARGAFKRSLGMRTPKLQFEHGTHPLFGSLPIGEFRSLTETKRGLEVEARIFDAELFAPLREAIASEAIDGMSIRFRPLKMDVTDPDGRDDGGDVELRTVTEAELVELGPVIFPAYAQTEVDLRSIDLTNENDRHRLVQVLLGGASLAGGFPGPEGQGTAPQEAGAPAGSAPDPVSHHSDLTPRRRSLLQRTRLHELMLE